MLNPNHMIDLHFIFIRFFITIEKILAVIYVKTLKLFIEM